MRQVLLLTCGLLLISSVVSAEEILCEDSGGIVITGAISKEKYCLNRNKFNWWSGVAWCEGLGKKMFDLNDCHCSNTIADCAGNVCAELKGVGTHNWVWLYNSYSSEMARDVNLSSGKITYGGRATNGYALCK